MCYRFTPLSLSEAEGALDALSRTGRATVPVSDATPPDARPGATVPLFRLRPDGALEVAEMTWGFEAPWNGAGKLVFNTRLDTAVQHAQRGEGLWARPLLEGRCIVPLRAFWESNTRERAAGAPTGGRAKRQVRFDPAAGRFMLAAAVSEDGRFSVVTTAPNADVAPVHDRMPLVLGPGESHVWLGPDFAMLADRSRIHLRATPDENA